MLKFTYTKSNGDASERVGIIVQQPVKLTSVLDITDLTDQERLEVQIRYTEYRQAVKELEEAIGITDMYKKYFKHFKPEGITDAVSI